MDDGWVCASCHSINDPGSGRCYKCRQPRVVDRESTGQSAPTPRPSPLQAGMITVCPVCGTHRAGWERRCHGCGLDYDELAKLQLIAAAASGPRSFGRLMFGRLPVLIPGLVLGVVLLAVLAVLQLTEAF